LIARRIELPVERYDAAVVEALGYSIQFSNQPPDIPAATYRHVGGVDAIDSLGAVIGADGTIKDVLLDQPLHAAHLGPGMKVVGVNSHAWSENRMRDAIAMSATRGQIELLVVSGDSFQTHRVEYAGGPRYMTLVKKPAAKDWLTEIVKPR
jgi:predicted metalloprotease with PDZ domain